MEIPIFETAIVRMSLLRLYGLCSTRLRVQFFRLLRSFRISARSLELPYDNTNPLIYIKDEAINCYTDEYVMALASAGDIHLVGMITSSSVAPYNQWVTSEDYERFVLQRAEGIRHARNSGFQNVPDPVRGPKGHLEKPASGKIEDTRAIGSDGSWLIVNQAKRATRERPLLLVCCTALTAAADAYLLDSSVADKLVVAWLGGSENDMADYDGWSDGWAAFIVLHKLRLVQFPAWQADPRVHKSRLTELPDTELRQWMIDKQHPNGSPGSRDADAPPMISVIRKDYALRGKKVSFSHWITNNGHELPVLKSDKNGRTLVVTCASRDVATEAWWKALKNPAAYNSLPVR